MKKEMKKNLFMVAAVALMAMISCNKEEINGTSDVQVPAEDVIADIPFEFSAYADGADTQAPSVNPASVQQKTTLNTTGDKPKTHWLATDRISVNGFEFSVDKETAYGESARFLGQVSESFAAPYKAVYPASAGSFDALEVPAVQTPVADDFDQSAVIGVAYSEKDNSLAFKNVTSLLKFQVPAACDQVTITSDVALAGTIKVNAVKVEKGDNGVDVTTIDYTVLTAKKEITVNGPFVTGKDYYVAVLPGVKTNFAVRVDGYFSRGAASVTPKRNVIMDMKTLPEPLRKVYVKNDLNLSDLSLYAWDAQQNALVGSWPGVKLSTTETINGNKYYVYDLKDVSASVTGIIVNGKATKSGSTKVLIQTGNITDNLKGNKYYRLSIRENYYKEVDPNDLSTFGFRIYVYIQKGDNHVDPYLHIWSTTGITNTNWNNQLKMTDSWVYPETGGKQFYYYEPPTTAYSSMNFIVTLNNGTQQTGDIKGALKNDYYVCAWADSQTSCGLYCNSTNNNSITATNIIKDNPEACK